MRHVAIGLGVIFVGAAFACGPAATSTKVEQPPPAKGADGPREPMAVCKSVQERNHACPAETIEAMLGIRVELGFPPGLAEVVAKNREAIMAQATKELLADTEGPRGVKNCEKLISGYPEAELAADMAVMDGCAQKTDCKEFTKCTMPIFKKGVERKKAKWEKATGVCVAMMAKGAECTEAFAGMLVDARVKLDFPAGFAEKAAGPARAEIVKKATEELKNDFAEPKRQKACQRQTLVAPAEIIASVKACNEKADCGEFAACMAPVQEKMFDMQKKQLAARKGQ